MVIILQIKFFKVLKSPSFAEGVLWERAFAKMRSNPQKINFIMFGLLRQSLVMTNF